MYFFTITLSMFQQLHFKEVIFQRLLIFARRRKQAEENKVRTKVKNTSVKKSKYSRMMGGEKDIWKR